MKAISRKDLIRKLRALGFEGPIRTGDHYFMHRGSIFVRIPGNEKPEVSADLQLALLSQLEIETTVWKLA